MSIFLTLPTTTWIAHNDLAFAIRDGFPVTPGHTLVITKRVVPDWFSATPEEQRAVFELVESVKRQLDEEEPRPDGYNVGFNAGEAAGQTVMHLHVHVIPRRRGDMDDPRGGVRHVIPSKGNYKRVVQPLATGGVDDPFSAHVLPLFERADEIAIVAAFVQESGVARIEGQLTAAVARGAAVRILTGDYLDITQASALETLLDWQRASRLVEEEDEENVDATKPARGRFEVRVVEVAKLPGPVASFHPKSWRFEGPGLGVAFVGSSNLSRTALQGGIEWNLRVDRDRDSEAYERVRTGFEQLWRTTPVLEASWLALYASRARTRPAPLPLGEVEAEAPAPVPEPHEAQVEALAALREARAMGRNRAVVVLATGLGKTWLAAFDYAQLGAEPAFAESGRRPRLLFLAHRRELLRQAAATYRRLLRATDEAADVGWCVEDETDLDNQLVFASVSKLARPEHLARLTKTSFDYVVVDEVHHAAAESYRRILRALEPTFLLGLTATPDRADNADVLGLFDDYIAYRADIARGIALGKLSPFHYFGLRDEIDYAQIPWKNRRFDPEKLAAAAQTEARMATLWKAWADHPGSRTLVFCCSIAHALFVRDWLRKKGVRANAVFADAASDGREASLEAFGVGGLDALCVVDMFNEGLDVPSIDRVVMLRPTESNVVFLQQLGRGLRVSEQKPAVNVIDFVGNHRVFLDRVRALLTLAGRPGPATLTALLSEQGALDLPEGCSVELALEAKNLLAKLVPSGGADQVERAYRELREERGSRPTAGGLERMGYLPERLRERHGSWFDFVRNQGDLSPEEASAFEAAGAFLRDLESTRMQKSFKMIVLDVLLEAGLPREGMDLRALAVRSHALLRRSPELWAEVLEEHRLDLTDDTAIRRWVSYWRTDPIRAWTAKRSKQRAWLTEDGDRLRLDLDLDAAHRRAFAALTGELVEYRLGQHRARLRRGDASQGFVCRVTWNKRDPILKMPARSDENVPEGETDVRLADGSVWQFRMAKEFCNVARPAGDRTNRLPDLLRRWFGPSAGKPGTAFEVRFHASPNGLWAEPLHRSAPANVVALTPRHAVIAYPDLHAAAGHAAPGVDVAQTIDPERVVLPLPRSDRTDDLFAVRVSGTSMDGGKTPIRDGDWALLRLARGDAASSLQDRVVLAQTSEPTFGERYQIKRLRRTTDGWELSSDNPAGPRIPATPDTVVIARVVETLHPEDLGPELGTTLEPGALAAGFGLDTLPSLTGRHSGNAFAFVDRKGLLRAPDELSLTDLTLRPGETVFVLAATPEGAWRYLGVGRPVEPGVCRIPEVDFATWRAWGEGRSASRRLPEGALARAQVAVDAILKLPDDQRTVRHPAGREARVLGRSAHNGIRIDGGETGFDERVVSLMDLAWVIVADDDVHAVGGLLDEARVNRARYLEGTPKGSTRWIDTGWAIGAWARARGLELAVVATNIEPVGMVRDDGSPVDASFSVERDGEGWVVTVEARGGTAGTGDARNTQYAEGLELLVRRIGAMGLVITDVQVDTARTAGMTPEERRVVVGGRGYPIVIGEGEAAEVAREVRTGAARVGREAGAKGAGNGTRRVQISVGLRNIKERQGA